MGKENKTIKGIDGERRERQVDFIRANWNLLCTIAYRNFLEKGIGMVVVAEADFIHEKIAVVAKIRITYLNPQELIDGNIIGDQEKGWLETTDPESTLLIGFLRVEGTGFDSYRINGFSPNNPKSIFERSVLTK
ncbi:MAG: hypothetical protein WCF96_09515 [Eubacteriales bacterium]